MNLVLGRRASRLADGASKASRPLQIEQYCKDKQGFQGQARGNGWLEKNKSLACIIGSLASNYRPDSGTVGLTTAGHACSKGHAISLSDTACLRHWDTSREDDMEFCEEDAGSRSSHKYAANVPLLTTGLSIRVQLPPPPVPFAS